MKVGELRESDDGMRWVMKFAKMRGNREGNGYGGYVKRWVTKKIINF